MQLYIIPSWYPTDIHPENGSFFRDRAQMLSKGGMNVTLFSAIQHSFRDILSYKKMTNTFNDDDGMDTHIYQTVNLYPKLEKCAFKKYQKFAIQCFNKTIAEQGKPDAVFFNSSLWGASALVDELKQKRIPFFVSEHLKEFMPSYKFSSFQSDAINNVYSYATAIIAPSSALQKSIATKFPDYKNKVLHLPNPVDEDIFTFKEDKDDTSRVNFICVGLFRPEKNINIIIDSFATILKKNINTHLTLVGDGPLKGEIENQIRKLNIQEHITLKGYLAPLIVAKELKRSDVLVSASSVETFGMSILEAQSCGLPAIVTDCGGPSDIINEKTGILIDSLSQDSLSNAMSSIIHNISNYVPHNIREQAVDSFGKAKYSHSIKKIIAISI